MKKLQRFKWAGGIAVTLIAQLALGAGGDVNGVHANAVVAADGSGDFKTVQEAVDGIGAEASGIYIIAIKPGTYHEKIQIRQPSLHLVGHTAEDTILTFDDFALKKDANGNPLGTSGSYSVSVKAKAFEASNITFENTAGPRATVAQTVALIIESDKAIFRNCRFVSHQDTLYANKGRQYYDHCFITGDVDYIFGNAAAVFDHCEIQSNGKGYITAHGRADEKQNTGYVFTNCQLTATADLKPNTVYLGRPWKAYARTVFMNCQMGPQIRKEGWSIWKGNDNDKTAFFAEYQNTGDGANADGRVAWGVFAYAADAEPFSTENFLKGDDDWSPSRSNTPAATQPDHPQP